MIRKIGKYEVRERIGRGGMGMILKAHDPVLDRPVAIKIFSDDIDVTEELRARFYREAQACGKLNHPNIVTIYDMGEDDGRLYIVMELLEGEELRHVISQRRRMALEDKVALMMQICDGLHYAHQKGVIHRDIKPGNIFVLRDGMAKIVDFGIAHVATLGAGLTRTGLVMGTLRYISPEQARGRADHRSDMFSLGSVFYELLAYRPALTGDDPMHLLEQLRSEEPPALTDVDPAIPADLSAVIARAMRKDPAERFADLGQMRMELEQVQHRLASTAADVRKSIARTLDRARQLHVSVTERAGADTGGPTAPLALPEERARLDTLRAFESEIEQRAQALEGLLERIEAASPAIDRGLAHLAAGRLGEAIADLEAVLADVPEHQRAREALAEARQRAEDIRERERVVHRVDEASAAFERGDYQVCLDIIADVADAASRLDLGPEVAGLRRATEAALLAEQAAREEEQRRQRQRADAAASRLEEARSLAHEVGAAHQAEALWLSAEEQAATGRAALGREDYAGAADAFEDAAPLYRRAEESARDVMRADELRRQRSLAERALQRMTQQQSAAQTVEAERRANAAWEQATARALEARAALGQEAFLRATEALEAATALFRRAEEGARHAIRQEEADHQKAEMERARAAASQAREGARSAGANTRAASLWQAAEAREVEATEAASERADARAARLFGESAVLYSEGERAAQAACLQEQQRADQALAHALEWRTRAEAGGAPELAGSLWTAAEAKLDEGRSAVTAERYVVAAQQGLEAEGLYREGVQAAQSRRRQLQDEATAARDEAARCRAAALGEDAAIWLPDVWREAEATLAEAEAAFSEGRHSIARDAFASAADLFGRAEQASRTTRREHQARQRQRADHARMTTGVRRAAAEELPGVRRAPSWVAAEAKAGAAEHAREEGRYAEATAMFEEAAALFDDARDEALRPTQPAPEALRVEADSGIREVEAAAAQAETIYSDREADRLEANRPGASALDRSPRADEAPGADEALTRVAAPTFADPPVLQDATRLAESPPVTTHEPKAAATGDSKSEGASDAAGVPRAATPALSLPDRGGATAHAEGVWRHLAGRRRVIAALGGLAAIALVVSGVVYFQRDVPAPIEDLRKEMTAAREEAVRAGAMSSRQFALAAGKEGQGKAALDRKDVNAAELRYREALTSYRLATSDAESASLAARAAQTRATDARQKAEVVKAQSRAAPLWTKAETAQREADRALDQHAFDRALTLFGEAAGSYQGAEQEAMAQLERERDEAKRIRPMVAGARKEGERADARRLAPTTFASAQQREDAALAALDLGDPGAAKAGFQEAQRMYKQAAQEAATQQLARQRGEAAQAQERVTKARRDAEQAAAGQRAAVLFAWAEKKQREATAAFGRSEFAEAERLFSETQADYEIAAQEARRGGLVASVRSTAEQAQRRAVSYRERAVKADADRLAPDLFAMARAKEGPADSLMTRGAPGDVLLQYYRDAGDLYLRAARRAAGHLEADGARTQMRAEKQRADQKAPEYRDAVAEEEHGTAAYERLAYGEAVERFRTARELYARAATKSVASPAAPPSQQIR